MSMYVVYMHTCIQTGKSYIGWTSRSIEQRWSEHVRYAELGCKFALSKAIRRYGSNDQTWKHVVLEQCSTAEDASQRAEPFWISHHRTYLFDKHSMGYNMTRGGDGAVGAKRSKETRQLMGELQKGKPRSEHTRKKISKSK